MPWRPDPYVRLRRLLRPDSEDDDLDAEMREHYDSLVEHYQGQGLGPSEAEARARARFGNLDQYRNEARAAAKATRRSRQRRESVSSLLQDLKVASRALLRRPGFTVAGVTTLMLALTGVVLALTLVDPILLRPLPYADQDRLVVLRHPVPGLSEGQEWNLSQAGFFYFQDNARSLESLGVWTAGTVGLSGGEGAERATATYASASLLDVLGARPVQGRLLQEADNAPGAPSVAVISHALWTQRFARAQDVVGTTIAIDARDAVVVGVMPPGLDNPFVPTDIWLPLTLDRSARAVNSHWMQAIGRLTPDATHERAQAELQALTDRLPDVHPSAYTPVFFERYGFRFQLHTLRDEVVGETGRVLWLLLAASLLVLLVAGSNVLGLFLVRSEARKQEMAVRASMGASGTRLTWMSITEVLLIAGAATAAALMLGWLGARAVTDLGLESLPSLLQPRLTWTTVAISAGLSTLLVLVIGILSRALPGAGPSVLRESGSAGTSPGRRRMREGMIVAQVALALVLVTGAGLLLRSMGNLRAVDPGVETQGTWMAELALPALRYRAPSDVNDFLQDLSRRLELRPEIVRVGATNRPPFSGIDGCSAIYVEGHTPDPGDPPTCVATPQVSAGYFDALGISVQGRTPTWSDRGTPGIVVSRAFAERFWPDQDPMGRAVRGNGVEPPYYHVAGVADHVHANGVDRPPLEAVYFPIEPIEGAQLWGAPRYLTLVVSTSLEGPALMPVLRNTIASLDPTVPVAELRSLGAVVAGTTQRMTLATGLITSAALLALFLAAVGMYGLLAYVVAQRKREIGVRMALGAREGRLVSMIVGRALVFAGIGVGLGLLGSLALSRSLRALLYDVSPQDPVTLVVACVALAGVTGLAAFGPARRAARVDPVEALRADA